MTEERALSYPLARAFALRNVVIEQNPIQRPLYGSPGYIAQERLRLAHDPTPAGHGEGT